MALSTSSPRGTGSCLLPNVEKLSGFARNLWPVGLKVDGSEEVVTVQIQPEPLPCGEITDIKTPDGSKPSGVATPRDVDKETGNENANIGETGDAERDSRLSL